MSFTSQTHRHYCLSVRLTVSSPSFFCERAWSARKRKSASAKRERASREKRDSHSLTFAPPITVRTCFAYAHKIFDRKRGTARSLQSITTRLKWQTMNNSTTSLTNQVNHQSIYSMHLTLHKSLDWRLRSGCRNVSLSTAPVRIIRTILPKLVKIRLLDSNRDRKFIKFPRKRGWFPWDHHFVKVNFAEVSLN